MNLIRTGVLFSLFLLLPASPATAEAADERVYFQLIYDFEVAGYCGLISKSISTTTGIKRSRIEDSTPLSDNELRKIRIAAIVAADREYQNRSLGGHKAWCQSDGINGVKRILDE